MTKATRIVCVLLLAAGWGSGTAAAQEPAATHQGLFRYPDISRTHIVFAYADDLWIVPRTGGTALPLASPPGAESLPRFSPDGATIAFIGNYDGDRDIYTVPTSGGIPQRVTHHPANEMLAGWTPDGRILFASNGLASLRRYQELFTVAPTGGLPTKLPVPYGSLADVSADGQWLAYTPHTRDYRTWKRYMGGRATDIWLFHLQRHTARRITTWAGTDTAPMWQGRTVWYLSDGGTHHRLNLWSYDTTSGRRRQVTRFEAFDVKFPAMGPGPRGTGEIVFQVGAGLRICDCATGRVTSVDVRVPGARASLRPRAVDVSKYITGWDVSPSARRAVVQARGDIWTLPAKNGSPRNLTRTSGAAERSPAWSPDGKWIAYFSDASDEYELYIAAAAGRGIAPSDGSGAPRRLTRTGSAFRYEPVWSPDSAHIVFHDKSGAIYLYSIDAGTTRLVAKDPWGTSASWNGLNWSHDSRWIAYARNGAENRNASIWLYHVPDQAKTRVTAETFNDSEPVFDRKGDYLYFRSNRHFRPRYGELESSFVYAGSEVLVVVPLRADQPSPWAPKSDEEGPDEKTSRARDGDRGTRKAAAANDAVSGTWEGTIAMPAMGDGQSAMTMAFAVTLVLGDDLTLTGSVTVSPVGGGEGGGAEIRSGSYDPATATVTFTAVSPDAGSWKVQGTIRAGTMSGTATQVEMGLTLEFSAKRTAEGGAAAGEDDVGSTKEQTQKQITPITIDLEGFEARALRVPVKPGRFGQLAVNAKHQLVYVRRPIRGAGGSASIHVVDVAGGKRKEQNVASGGSFRLTADGTKMLVVRRTSATIQDASAGATGSAVPTGGMTAWIEPTAEWGQIFHDAWRLQRDFFYDPGMHGVDWVGVRRSYRGMLRHCLTRNDVGFVIAEMISELNVGHAYYGGGDVGSEPSVSVGLLGCDYEFANGAYRIAKIHTGAPWDLDARGPLGQPGTDVRAGDYLLAVNGVPVDTSKDPWAAFLGHAGKVITLTVSTKPTVDATARTVVVKPAASEVRLRFRAWIEQNRAYVERRTNGRVGYVYVPDTGQNGQNELVRQYFGQLHKGALIIDERWNGGGQIPTRFIELLNRPIVNYWARRDGKSWPWPYDGHQGPKCMLINAHAGSGGDAFPAYFRQAGLGKLIGTRTWGGLVGMSGNPRLIDGARMTVPTFGYYKPDGTWGIEGHGVDPDIEVIDDPGKMVGGIDVQLDAAIAHIVKELEKHPYVPPKRPEGPDRSGMGIPPKDR